MSKWKAAGMVVLVLAAGAAVATYQATPVKAQGGPARVTPVEPALNEVTDWVAGWPELTKPPIADPKTQAILEALEKPLAMHFPNDTPLEDVKKYIQESTKGPGLPNGIPIYVDPIGLQDADKTMSDTVAIELEGIPLKTTLRLLLRQISLMFQVKDGLLIVTSTAEEEENTPFSIMQEKARRGDLTRERYKQLIEALKLRKQVEALSTDDSTFRNGEMGGGANPAGKPQTGGFR